MLTPHTTINLTFKKPEFTYLRFFLKDGINPKDLKAEPFCFNVIYIFSEDRKCFRSKLKMSDRFWKNARKVLGKRRFMEVKDRTLLLWLNSEEDVPSYEDYLNISVKNLGSSNFRYK